MERRQAGLRKCTERTGHLLKSINGELVSVQVSLDDQADVRLEEVASNLIGRCLQVFLAVMQSARRRVECRTKLVRRLPRENAK